MEYASSREGLHHKLLESESKPSLPSLVRPRAECYGGKVRGSKGPGSTEICLGGNSRAWCFREPLDGPVAVPGVDDKEIRGPLEQSASCQSIRACLRFRDDKPGAPSDRH
ncbi:hypothetical protein FSOLCH5_005995 [Fusarium solani]